MTLAEAPLVLMLVGLTAYAVLGGADFGAAFWQFGARGERGRRAARARLPGDGPRLGGQPRLACLRAGRLLDRLSAGVRLDLLDAERAAVHRRDRHHPPRHGLRRPRRNGARDRAAGDRRRLLDLVASDPVRARHRSRRDRVRARPDRQRRGRSADELAEPDVAARRHARRRYWCLRRGRLSRGRCRPRQAWTSSPRAFRTRALAAGVVTGAIAFAGLAVVAYDADRLADKLFDWPAVAAIAASAAAGIATLELVRRWRFEAARYGASAAVAAVVAGWALAQRPELLPGLTVEEAAAGRPVLIATIVGVALGGRHPHPVAGAALWTRPPRPLRRAGRRAKF